MEIRVYIGKNPYVQCMQLYVQEQREGTFRMTAVVAAHMHTLNMFCRFINVFLIGQIKRMSVKHPNELKCFQQ